MRKERPSRGGGVGGLSFLYRPAGPLDENSIGKYLPSRIEEAQT